MQTFLPQPLTSTLAMTEMETQMTWSLKSSSYTQIMNNTNNTLWVQTTMENQATATMRLLIF